MHSILDVYYFHFQPRPSQRFGNRITRMQGSRGIADMQGAERQEVSAETRLHGAGFGSPRLPEVPVLLLHLSV